MKDTLNYKLRMSRRLSKAHWHSEPPELTLVGNKGRVIQGGALEWDVVEASLQVKHADPLSPPKLGLVLPHVVELVLVLGHQFIDQDDVLTYPVRLPRLNAQY